MKVSWQQVDLTLVLASESLMNKQVIYSTINDGSTLKVRSRWRGYI